MNRQSECAHREADAANTLAEPLEERSTFAATCANFSIQYNFAEIGVGLQMMKSLPAIPQAPWVGPTLSSAVFIGAIVGQVGGGYIADRMPRARAMALAAALTAAASLAAAAVPSSGSAATTYTALAVCRLLLGTGVGCFYPISATAAAEAEAPGDTRAARVARVCNAFFWQSPGAIAPYAVGLALVSPSDPLLPPSLRWRALFALGAVPALFILGNCVRACYTSRSDQAASADAAPPAATAAVATRARAHRSPPLKRHEAARRVRQHWRSLLGTGLSWFLFDIAYYGTTIFSPLILSKFFDKDNLVANCEQAILVNSMGVPAVMLTTAVLRHAGLHSVQLYGFLFQAAAFATLGVAYQLAPRNSTLLLSLFCVVTFALSTGPNVTTYALPPEMFPREVRATFNGLSAALGKLGAVVGTVMYQPLTDYFGVPFVMHLCAAVCAGGAALTWACISQRENAAGEVEYFMVENDEDDASACSDQEEEEEEEERRRGHVQEEIRVGEERAVRTRSNYGATATA